MKTLIIRFSSGGDILLAADAAAALKKNGARVDMLVKKGFADAALEAGADRVIGYDPGKTKPAELVKELNENGYDAVFDLHSNPRSRLIMMFLKAGRKKSIKKKFWRRRCMVWFKAGKDTDYSVREAYLKTCGFEPDAGSAPHTPEKTDGFFNILLHAGAKHPLKRWPHYAELAKLLSERKDCRVTITGVKDEVEKDDEILYIEKENIRNLIGKTTQKELFREIKKCGVFAGNDTMAAHAAALYGKKAVVFLGPTVSGFGFITKDRFDIIERDLMCRPCHIHGAGKCPVGDFRCLDKITPRQACERIQKYL
ncbi:MAG: glycosyltransferase family 9 protein [Candidatus Goldiibacteriota bacterium]